MNPNDPTLNKTLGTGLAFPIKLDSSGKAVISNGVDLIKSSIAIIIMWSVGTRLMLGEFGTLVPDALQQNQSPAYLARLKNLVYHGLTRWEKRIKVNAVELNTDNDPKLTLTVNYSILNTPITDSYIFPLYKYLNT